MYSLNCATNGGLSISKMVIYLDIMSKLTQISSDASFNDGENE